MFYDLPLLAGDDVVREEATSLVNNGTGNTRHPDIGVTKLTALHFA